MNLMQRLRDWHLEWVISQLAAKAAATHSRSDWHALAAAVRQRSPDQVARMERARGLR